MISKHCIENSNCAVASEVPSPCSVSFGTLTLMAVAGSLALNVIEAIGVCKGHQSEACAARMPSLTCSCNTLTCNDIKLLFHHTRVVALVLECSSELAGPSVDASGMFPRRFGKQSNRVESTGARLLERAGIFCRCS